jgi:hypothetical protein
MQKLFNGQFKDKFNVSQKYKEHNEAQRNRLQQLFDSDIEQLRHIPATGRIFLETFEDATKRFDLKMERAYRFVANPVREAQQLMYIFNTLLEQVERNI